MIPPTFVEILHRFREGDKMKETEFDMSIFKTAERIKAKFDIRYDPENPVPLDEDMADRCFQAGRELYTEVGTYSLDTARVARFSLEEMDAAVGEAPDSVVWGEGEDDFTMRHRPVEGEVEPFVWGGLQTLLYSDEETAFRVIRATCRCRDINGVWGGIVPKLESGDVVGASPEEIFPYRRSAVTLRRAADEAGRPGIPVMNSAPLSFIHFAMFASREGLRVTDGIETPGVPELKTSNDALNRVAFALATDTVHSGGVGVTIGGFSGSIEGAAIVAVAGAYQSLLVNRAKVVALTATPIMTFSRATRKGIWVGSLALQALNRNTRLITGGFMCDHPAAGPGTEQYFYETAAGTIPGIVCGTHAWGGTRKFKIGRKVDFGSPVESDFLGHLSKAAVGLDRSRANIVVRKLLEKYEKNIKEAPEGYTLQELYDLPTESPSKEYAALYNKVAAELRNLGVPLENYS